MITIVLLLIAWGDDDGVKETMMFVEVVVVLFVLLFEREKAFFIFHFFHLLKSFFHFFIKKIFLTKINPKKNKQTPNITKQQHHHKHHYKHNNCINNKITNYKKMAERRVMKHTTTSDWEAQQKKIFARWVNDHLSSSDLDPIIDIGEELDNGVHLVILACTLYKLPAPKSYIREPKNLFQRLGNINASFKMYESAGVKLPFTKAENITGHDLKMVLGLIWSIILHYNTSNIKNLLSEAGDSSAAQAIRVDGGATELKRIIGGWVQEMGVDARGFGKEWKDGMHFLTLMHSHDASLVPDYETRTGETAEDNLVTAFDAGEKIGAPRLLYPEDLLDVETPDEHSIITYLAELHTATLVDNRRKEKASKEKEMEKSKKLSKSAAAAKAAQQLALAAAEEKAKTLEKENRELEATLTEKNKALEKGNEENRAVKSELEGLKTAEKRAASEKDRLRNDLRRLQDENKRLKSSPPQPQQKNNNQLMTSSGTNFLSENRNLRSEIKRLEEENKRLRENGGGGGLQRLPRSPRGNGQQGSNVVMKRIDPQMALIAFLNVVLSSFLPGLAFLVFGTISFVLLADIFFPEKTQVLREKLDDEQIRKGSLGVLGVNLIMFAGKLLLTE